MPVKATKALVLRSQLSCWLVTRLRASAALARAKAATAGAVKPAAALSSDRRAVSARDAASARATVSNCVQVDRRNRFAPLQPPPIRGRRATGLACLALGKAASFTALLAPTKSSSQLACRPTSALVAAVVLYWLTPRLCRPRRWPAAATPRWPRSGWRALAPCGSAPAPPTGSAAWAASISSTNSGSPWRCHQWPATAPRPGAAAAPATAARPAKALAWRASSRCTR